jgi:hypothetical protein
VSLPTDDVKNWMHMFRWIVKTIRDEYEVDETMLTRSAVLESDCGLAVEQVETVLDTISGSFKVTFPPGTLDEVVRLEELCNAHRLDEGTLQAPGIHLGGLRADLSGCQRGMRIGGLLNIKK